MEDGKGTDTQVHDTFVQQVRDMGMKRLSPTTVSFEISQPFW